jgi:subtilase family protein
VDAAGQRCSYSSCGPNSPSLKPDLVATIPFPSAWRGRPFAGTSAASPQAASLAALIWSRHPNWPARRVAAELRADAEQLNKSGPDFETGYGRIRLPSLPSGPGTGSYFMPQLEPEELLCCDHNTLMPLGLRCDVNCQILLHRFGK